MSTHKANRTLEIPTLSKIPPANLTNICRPPVLRTSRSVTLAQLADGELALAGFLQSAALIANTCKQQLVQDEWAEK